VNTCELVESRSMEHEIAVVTEVLRLELWKKAKELDVKHYQPLSITAAIPACYSPAKTSPDYDLEYSVTFLEETEEELESFCLETSSILWSCDEESLSPSISPEWDGSSLALERSVDMVLNELDIQHHSPQRLIAYSGPSTMHVSVLIDELDEKHHIPKHFLKFTQKDVITESIDELDVKHYCPKHFIECFATELSKPMNRSSEDELDKKHYIPKHSLRFLTPEFSTEYYDEKEELDERHYSPIHLLRPAQKTVLKPLSQSVPKSLTLSLHKPEDRGVEDLATPREIWRFDESNAFMQMGTFSSSEVVVDKLSTQKHTLSASDSCASFLSSISEDLHENGEEIVHKEATAMISPSKSLPHIPKLSLTTIVSPDCKKNSPIAKLALQDPEEEAETDSDVESETARDDHCVSSESTSEESASAQLTDRVVDIPLLDGSMKKSTTRSRSTAAPQPSKNEKNKGFPKTTTVVKGSKEKMMNIRDENQENYCMSH
jgi:hypothetical protein